MSQYYAHSLPGRPVEEWEPLEDHLRAVANLAAKFADKFGAAEWGRLLGLWHDLGKYSAAFQAFLLRANGIEAHLEQQPGRVDHSTAGAQHAAAEMKPWGRLLAYAIAGHHAGLSDSTGGTSSLANRLVKGIEPFDAAPSELLQVDLLPQPALSIYTKDEARASFQALTPRHAKSLPARGARIETSLPIQVAKEPIHRSPHGERGLKLGREC